MWVYLDTSVEECKIEEVSTTSVGEEKWYITAGEIIIPFMIAGFGMVAAGLVLERVKVKHEEFKNRNNC